MNFRNLLTRALVAVFALAIGSQALAARTTTFLHGDGLGSVVAATNEAGAVLWRKDYAPFGEQIQSTPVAERTSYTGKPHDDLTGLTYFGGRNFDPELGRFVSVDPAAFMESNTMSFNRYLYVNNNPYKYVDPDGELLNFALKFVFDVAINIAINYVTTGEMNVGGALKESALGILNPAKSMANVGRLGMVLVKANKVTPDPGAVAGFAAKTAKVSAVSGRSGKQARLRELANDPKVSSADRGWIKNEKRHVESGNRKTIRMPRNSRNSSHTEGGSHLAHPKGQRAKDGHGYENAKIQDSDLHRLEHKHEGYK